jgi:RsiW-degrading membrane proteinase PrsW (M82 family)
MEILMNDVKRFVKQNLQIILFVLCGLFVIGGVLTFVFGGAESRGFLQIMFIIFGILLILLAAAFALLALVVGAPFSVLAEMVPVLDYTETFWGALYGSFFMAAVPEELAKLLMLYLLLRKNPYFDERMDGIVYAVAVGMGFAGFENILYLFENEEIWGTIGAIRALFSVPGHFCFAVFMGYYYSLAHFDKKNRQELNLFLMLAVPIVLHGVFDFLLMSLPHLHPALIIMAVMAFLGLCIGMNLVAHIKMRHHLKADEIMIAEAEAAISESSENSEILENSENSENSELIETDNIKDDQTIVL